MEKLIFWEWFEDFVNKKKYIVIKNIMIYVYFFFIEGGGWLKLSNVEKWK